VPEGDAGDEKWLGHPARRMSKKEESVKMSEPRLPVSEAKKMKGEACSSGNRRIRTRKLRDDMLHSSAASSEGLTMRRD
jgi:hypothetical protein